MIQLDILEYLHDKEYVHADIKASNLLVGYADQHQVPRHTVIIEILSASFVNNGSIRWVTSLFGLVHG